MRGTLQRILTFAGRGCVAALALALVLHGSTKRPPVRQSAAPQPPVVRTAPSVAPVPGIPDPPEVPPGMCAATNWWRRGAFSGWRRVDFPAGWSFPWGTGRLRSAALLACGEVRPLGGDGPVASVGVPLGLPPLEGVLWYGPTPSNTYAFAWQNALAGRDRARPVDARIELFRNGDVAVSTNGVTRRIPRELPFPHDGYGQDAEWVRANFTNAEEILSVGYSDWVDARVGTGLANGLYRFEAVFPVDPPEATRLVVGDLSVCVTNAGAYAFLLGKGREYRFRTEPHDGTVQYSYVDDLLSSCRVLRSSAVWGGDGVWSTGGGGVQFSLPTMSMLGAIRWMPTIRGYPDVVHVGPDDCPISFSAILSDVGPGVAVDDFRWTASGAITLSSLTRRTVELGVAEWPSWNAASIGVSTRISGVEMSSRISFSYGTNDLPQVGVGLNVPSALLLRDEWIESSRSAIGRVSFHSDVETGGVVRVSVVDGLDRVDIGNSCLGDHPFEGRNDFAIEFPIDGISVSSSVGDVTLQCEYLDEDGTVVCSAWGSLTVVSPQRISVAGDAVPDVAVLVGMPIGLSVVARPTDSVISDTMWYDAKLRSNRTYTDWRAWMERGGSITRVMAEGGIFIVRARAVFPGPQWADVYYAWAEDEDPRIGLHSKGEANHIGVASTLGQLELRVAARAMLGDVTYAFLADLPARNGFSGSCRRTWKCNAFVADMAITAGLTVPVQHRLSHLLSPDGLYPPLANEWAKGNVAISGWEYLGRGVWPEPGYVVGHPASVGSGHVGIVDFDGEGVAAGRTEVNRRCDWFLDGTSGFSVYVGTGGGSHDE